MDSKPVNNEILMPIREDFLEIFEIFMDENQKTKIRANTVRQYAEGIIDLLLKDKIVPVLKPNEVYEGINWGRKIKIIREHYDSEIADDIQEIFKVGGDGSHFSGKVEYEDLQMIINKAVHIIENIFVKYFLTPGHEFGTENIFTIFSMLPLKHRIYILERVSKYYTNKDVVDRLSLAYVKSGDSNKAIDLLKKSLQDETIDRCYYEYKLKALSVLEANIDELYRQNAEYEKSPESSKAIIVGDLWVVGLPTSKNVFDTAKAMRVFSSWFEKAKDQYPEFINLFFYLMKTDERQYI